MDAEGMPHLCEVPNTFDSIEAAPTRAFPASMRYIWEIMTSLDGQDARTDHAV